MATVYHASGQTDWSQVAAWTDGIGGAGTVPVSTDTVIFDTGSDAVTNGLSNAAVDLTSLSFTPGFTGSVGNSGTSLNIAVFQTSTGILTYAGSGTAYITAGTNGIWTARVTGNGKLFLTGGTITILEVTRGLCDVNDQVTLNSKTVRLYGGSTAIDYKGSDSPTTIDIMGGSHYIRRAAATVNVYGGSVVYQVDKAAAAISSALNVYGGLVDFRAGSIAALNGNGGAITFENAVRPITVTAATLTSVFQVLSKQGKAAKVTWPSITWRGEAVNEDFTT